MSALVIAFPRSAEPFLLDTDAINVGIGAVLFLKCATVKNVSLPTNSHALSNPERNYCTSRYELLAVVKVIDHFHPTSMPDSSLSELTMLLFFINVETARWLEKLQTYDFPIAYRAIRKQTYYRDGLALIQPSHIANKSSIGYRFLSGWPRQRGTECYVFLQGNGLCP